MSGFVSFVSSGPGDPDLLTVKALKRLQDAVATRSADLGLPDGVLASRRWLETLLDGEDWPGALSGWRRRQLESTLAPLLAAGGVAAPSV